MFEMQIKTKKVKVDDTGICSRVWRSVRSSNGEPYRYETEKEAMDMLNNLYPNVLIAHARVVEVKSY